MTATLRVLVACEFSGRVRDAFIELGHEAWSVDLRAGEGRHPYGERGRGGHYRGSIFDCEHYLGPYDSFDLLIAHPPCTYLTTAAEWAYSERPTIKGKPRKMKPGTLIGAARQKAREEALQFVEALWQLPIKRKCIENPRGVIPRYLPHLPKAQWVQQYEYGEDASKSTGLILDNLPELKPTKFVQPRMVCTCGAKGTPEEMSKGCRQCGAEWGTLKPRWGNQTDAGQNNLPPSEDREKLRSLTPVGLAKAMAEQWGGRTW
jgi:hypothetical protein